MTLQVVRDLMLIAVGVAGLVFVFRALSGKTESLTDRLAALHDAAMADLDIKQVLSEVGRAAPDPIWFKSADADFAMFWISDDYERRFLEPYGLTRADYIGQTDYAVWPPPIAEDFRRHDRAALRGPDVVRTLERDRVGRWVYVTKSRHTTQSGRTFIRGQSIDLPDILNAIAGKLSASEALGMVRSAYDESEQ